MYAVINARGPDRVPAPRAQPAAALFFIAFQITGGFFIMNLFVGVVIAAYNRERERLGKNFLLSKE